MRSTHPFEQEEVMAYLDGEMSADRAAEIAQHMQQCAECKSLSASFRNLSQQFAAWEIESSPARLTEQMNEQVAATQNLGANPAVEGMTPLQRLVESLRLRRTRPWAWVAVGGLVAIFAVVVAIPNLLRSHNSASSEGAAIRDLPLNGRTATELRAVPPQPGTTDGTPEKYLDEVRKLQALQQKVEQGRMSSALVQSASSAAPAPPPPTPSGASSTSSTPASLPMIARTATLSIVVKDIGSVESAVKNVTVRHSGYIGDLNTSTPPDAAKTFSATLRIPSAQLDAALTELKQLGRMEQETQSGEEVTKQYTDLVARLKNSRATEQRLLDVLRNNTGKVKDVLEVESEIARVRGEIEEMEADQRGLQSRVDFATLTLSVNEEYKASLQDSPRSTGTRLHNSFVEGYRAASRKHRRLARVASRSRPNAHSVGRAALHSRRAGLGERIRRALTTAPKPAAA